MNLRECSDLPTNILRCPEGNAKFAFGGINNAGYITTFHTESGKSFWKMLNGTDIPVINPK